MKIEVTGDKIGIAAATRMWRGTMVKGIEALKYRVCHGATAMARRKPSFAEWTAALNRALRSASPATAHPATSTTGS